MSSPSKYEPKTSLLRHIHADDYDACRMSVEKTPDVVHSIMTYEGLCATPLVWAAYANVTLDICRLLLDHTADVNAKADPTRQTALHVAVTNSHVSLVSLLCARGATVEDADLAGNSPLHVAVAQGDVATTCVLLDYGADANQPDHVGRTPLHLGVSSRLEICQHLLAHRAEVNAMDDDWFTPLDTALLDFSEDEPIVMYLVDEGARCNQMRHK
jgi:ankyrin repeat protein